MSSEPLGDPSARTRPKRLITTYVQSIASPIRTAANGAASAKATFELFAWNSVPSVYRFGGSSTWAVERSPSTNANTSTPAAARPGRASGKRDAPERAQGAGPERSRRVLQSRLDLAERGAHRDDREGDEQHRARRARSTRSSHREGAPSGSQRRTSAIAPTRSGSANERYVARSSTVAIGPLWRTAR